jgi:hypothetical protein
MRPALAPPIRALFSKGSEADFGNIAANILDVGRFAAIFRQYSYRIDEMSHSSMELVTFHKP